MKLSHQEKQKFRKKLRLKGFPPEVVEQELRKKLSMEENNVENTPVETTPEVETPEVAPETTSEPTSTEPTPEIVPEAPVDTPVEPVA